MKKLYLSVATFLISPGTAFAHGSNDGHMHDWGHMVGGGMFMWIPFVVLIVVAIYFAVRSTESRRSDSSFKESRPENAIEILEKRYAGGEITKEEFRRMKKDLES